MEHDDERIGRVLTRREVIALLGASGAALVYGRMGRAHELPTYRRRLPACIARPEQTEGPYFVDERLNRSDIRSDPESGEVAEGLPLELVIATSLVSEDGGCTPAAGLYVDLWQCDALGRYSDVRDRSFDTTGQKFLRGYQVTDESGTARFRTIYPGWYPGRTVHLHFKVRTDPAAARGYDFTSQLYFDDAVTDRVHGQQPYASQGRRTVRNEGDGIFRRGGGQLMPDLVESGPGYRAQFDLGLRLPS